MAEHGQAIEYDLLCRTGHALADVPKKISWSALDAFVTHLDGDSALMRELHPDTALWSSLLKTNVILADLYDLIEQMNNNLVAIPSGKPSQKGKGYRRPGKDQGKDERTIGSGAMPPNELEAWFEAKRNGKHD